MLTVSIVSHGQGTIAQRVLDDLAQEGEALRRVIVTRNVPEAWTPHLAHPSAELVVIDHAAPRGFGANHNAAFTRCDTPFFAALNPDLMLGGARLSRLLPRFDDETLGALTPLIVNPAGAREDFARDLMTLRNLVRRRLHRPPGRITWVAGICLLLRAKTLRAIGGFDEAFFMYCEDVDLCDRLALAGWNIGIDEDVCVTHDARRRSLRDPRHFAWHVQSLLRYWGSETFRQRLRTNRQAGRVINLKSGGLERA